MKSSKKSGAVIFSAAITILSVVLCLGVELVFHSCGAKDDGSWMNCHYAQQTVAAVSAVCAAAGALGMLIKKRAARALFHGISAVLSVICALIPGTIIHLCMMPDMRCRAVMRPCVIILSLLIFIAAVSALVFEIKGRNPDEK